MVQQIEMGTEKELSLAAKLWWMITGNWVSQALYVAAELDLPGLLAKEAIKSSTLAAATGVHEPYLQRLLRALVSIDILREREDGSFELTELGSLLRSDHPSTIRSWALYSGRQLWNLWGHLLDSVKTGKSGQELIFGTTGFGHFEGREELAEIFNRSMVEITRIISDSVAKTYDFSGCQRVMDVGGGYGQLLSAILRANPGVSGVLFDLPRVLEGARKNLADMGLSDRCEVISGSFFERIPSGCDVYLLKSILHDWPDDLSNKILTNCRNAITGENKLLIIDRVYPDRIEVTREHQMIARADLNMMLGPGGLERTESEWRNLLNTSGFQIDRIIPLEIAFLLIEASPTP
jgi:SAM-dependent methyltransferase